MTDTILGVALLLSGCYMFMLVFMMTTRNGLSALLFQFAPFLIGVLNLVVGCRMLNLITINL